MRVLQLRMDETVIIDKHFEDVFNDSLESELIKAYTEALLKTAVDGLERAVVIRISGRLPVVERSELGK